MRLVSTLTLTALLATTGCSFVTQGEVLDVKDAIDSDEDGVPDGLDCRPTNPAIFPGLCIDASSDLGLKRCPENPDNPLLPPIYDIPPAVEIVGDGVDNDCFGGDELDADGDTYPVMTEAEYRERFDTNTPWPTTLRVRADCDDNDPTINPAEFDPAYDGIDQDCGCYDASLINTHCNDFDQDGDGQIPPQYEATARAFFAQYPVLGISGNEPDLFGDCDDTPDGFNTYRGAPYEEAYDGIDTDCSGDNDFDQDGDGYIPTMYREDYNTFVETFHPNGVPASWAPDGEPLPLDGDCMDLSPSQWPYVDPDWEVLPSTYPIQVAPDQVHPNAPDFFADGIDSDCAGDNDFDEDGDGVVVESASVEDIEAYRRNWGGYDQNNFDTLDYPDTIIPFDLVFGDCNDQDPSVYPGQVEALMSPTDYDCDGNPISSPFEFHTFLWENPGHPRAVVTDQEFVIGTTANWFYKTSLAGTPETRLYPSFVLRFNNQTSKSTDAPIEQPWLYASATPPAHIAAFDMMGVGDTYWVASAYHSPPFPEGNNSTTFTLVQNQLSMNTIGYRAKSSTGLVESPYPGIGVDLDLTMVDGSLWMISSGGAGRSLLDDQPDGSNGVLRAGVIDYSTFTTSGTIPFPSIDTFDIASNSGNASFQRSNPTTGNPEFVVCDDAGCDVFEPNGSIATGSFIQSSADSFEGSYQETDTKNGMALLVRSGTGGFDVHDADGTVYNFMSGHSILSGDAVWADTTGSAAPDTLFIAVVEQSAPANILHLGWASASTLDTPEWHVLNPNDPNPAYTHCIVGETDPATCSEEAGRNLNPERVELAATQFRLMVTYTGKSLDIPVSPELTEGGQDAFGWAFFSYYPDADGDGFPGDPDGLGQVSPNFLDPDDDDPSIPVSTP